MGDYPSRQGVNDVRVLGEGLNGMRIKPPSHLMGDPWNETPLMCKKCLVALEGQYYDAPNGYFCGMECAGESPDRPVSYREAAENDPLLALREALRGAR